MTLATPRLNRLPAGERGITIGDFLVPIAIGERISERSRHLALIAIGAFLIALTANVQVVLNGQTVTLPGDIRATLTVSHVPITAQTFAVLLVGGALGFRRGLMSVGLYLALGLALPVYAQGASGIDTFVGREAGRWVLGATGGYLLGFLLAGAIVGRLAELGWDRHVGGAVVAMLLLGGVPRAILLQLAHPLVAEGGAQHSDFRTDPWSRLAGTLRSYLRIIYASRTGATAEIARLNRLHRSITGVVDDPEARAATGVVKYAARDPGLSLWVHATLVESTLAVNDAWRGPMSPGEAARFYAETLPIGRAFGIPAQILPADLAARRGCVARGRLACLGGAPPGDLGDDAPGAVRGSADRRPGGERPLPLSGPARPRHCPYHWPP